MNGGGQERGLRSGTVPTPLVVGLGAACRVAQQEMEIDHAHVTRLEQRLRNGIMSQLDVLPPVSLWFCWTQLRYCPCLWVGWSPCLQSPLPIRDARSLCGSLSSTPRIDLSAYWPSVLSNLIPMTHPVGSTLHAQPPFTAPLIHSPCVTHTHTHTHTRLRTHARTPAFVPESQLLPQGVVLNGPEDPAHRYVGNCNLSFAYVEGESLLMGLKVSPPPTPCCATCGAF